MDLKVGDIVKLKTGGPAMTVNRVGPYGMQEDADYLTKNEVLAVWFTPDDCGGWNGAFSDIFGAEALEIVKPETGQIIGRPEAA